MDSTSIDLRAAMRQKIRYLAERQSVISQNIANANTPDYKAQDLKAPSFSELVAPSGKGGVKLAVTSPKHIQLQTHNSLFKVVEDESAETSPDGNSVVLEEQMMHMAKTSLDYQTTVNLYQKMGKLIKEALGRGQ